MSRIQARFAKLRSEGRSALAPFITACDPDLETSARILNGLPAAGADLIELGMPFTDPMAEGPSIQVSYLRALKAGATMKKTLDLVRGFRARDNETPITLMGYFNPIHHMGCEAFCKAAAEAGVDGLIVVDLPAGEDAELRVPANRYGIDLIRLAAPTTDDKRLPTVVEGASGFLYYVSITGITGAATPDFGEVETQVARIRKGTSLPIVVGFGIKTPEHARAVAKFADAAAVGSALVSEVGAATSGDDAVARVHGLVSRLAEGMRERAMNWLTNTVLPKIRALGQRKEVKDNLWRKCPACAQMTFHRDLEAVQFVCPHCGHHMRMGAKARMAALFDDGQYQKIAVPDVPADPLRFRDSKRYSDRLKEARAKGDAQDAMTVGLGRIGGTPAVVAVQDFAFMGGSMGMAVGEAFIAAALKAVNERCALVAVTASGGARMQEGILSLMQMPRSTVAIQRLREAGLPYVVVLTDPTTGGVTASYAMLGDIQIAEPGALIGFAGPRVIEQTIRETLPEGFQRSEYLLEHGMLDMVVHRHQLKETLARLLGLLAERTKTHPAAVDGEIDLPV